MKSETPLIDVFNKQHALRISGMIESKLIWFEHYFDWADHLIQDLDEPPLWIVEIATMRYFGDAIASIREFVSSEPFEPVNGDEYDDEYVACLLLRHRSGAISWATFLTEAGSFTDARGGRRPCEYFYAMLNDLEHREFSCDVEARQRAEIESEYREPVAAIAPVYEMFMNHFRNYVACHPVNSYPDP